MDISVARRRCRRTAAENGPDHRTRLPREVWWIYGARNGGEHPFAAETRALLEVLPRSHNHICYSAPGPADRRTVDFDTAGRLGMPLLRELGVPRDADFYLCGPTAFMSELTAELAAWGARPTVSTLKFSARAPQRHRCGRGCTPAAASAGRASGHGPSSVVRTKRHQYPLGFIDAEPPRTRRSLRCPRTMVVPDRGMPQLRDRADWRHGRLPARSRRTADRR
jgi:hypothetical protein